MLFNASPALIVGAISAVLTGIIAYESRKSELETEQKRERQVKERLAEKTFPTNTWGITCDDVIVIEDSGLWYRFKKFITGQISGEVAVTVKYENASIPGEVWEFDAIQEIFTTLDFSVEHVETHEQLDPTHAKFVLGTVEWGDIAHFIHSIIMIEEYGREQMGIR